MKIGYARVSTEDQDLSLQLNALSDCDRVITDEISGSKSDRPGLNQLLEIVREGDTVIVWRLDRLGRSTKQLIEWMTWFESQGIDFKSIQEQVDTTTSTGRLVFHIFAALAEFERNLIRERTNAGLKAARARGNKGGRPKALTAKQIDTAQRLHQTNMSIADICRQLNCSRATLYRYLSS